MDWFTELFGFSERNVDTQKYIEVQQDTLRVKQNGKEFICGTLTIPKLSDIRQEANGLLQQNTKTTVSEWVGDVQQLHKDPQHTQSIFQVASQCNLLEMVGPSVSPEQGITGYMYDRTQGPACAIACAAGTVYRNYFVPVGTQIGQTRNQQVDTLADLGMAWGNENDALWSMQNGYALATKTGLEIITTMLHEASTEQLHDWQGLLRIGMHWNTEVTLLRAQGITPHLVHQAYCSAMPVAYSPHSSTDWKAFACLVLDAAYENTLLQAVKNREETGVSTVFLTLLGGGAFGNDSQWIADAILKALRKVQYAGLQVVLVSYGRSNTTAQQIMQRYNQL